MQITASDAVEQDERINDTRAFRYTNIHVARAERPYIFEIAWTVWSVSLTAATLSAVRENMLCFRSRSRCISAKAQETTKRAGGVDGAPRGLLIYKN